MTGPRHGGSGGRRSRYLDWKAIVGITISAVLLYVTFSRMDLGEVWQQLRGVNLPLFILATAIVTFVFWIRAWRWRAILEPVADVPFRERFAAVNIGFMGNNLLPARIGEFLRAYALSRLARVPVVGGLASLVVERVFDGIFVIGLLFLAMLSPQFPALAGVQEIAVPGTDQSFTIAGLAGSLAVLVGLIVAVLFALVFWPRRAVRVAEWAVSWMPASFRRPIVSALEAFLAGAGVLRNPRLMLGTAAWSAVLWFWNALGFWVGMLAFGLALPYPAAMFLASSIALAASLPSAPGFIGPWHLMATFVLADMWGANIATAGAFAVGFHMAGFVPVTLMGLYYAWRMGLSLDEAAASEEVVEDAVEQETGVDLDGGDDGRDDVA
ncbi:MAG TPA: lysylphosphatidylglycerol synthase transmembrane domain-containing protein [Longimicrobiales bacterium]|nr:lysylphosphatidylglycerol synthase transmembrane domain-containing protein [Longimicrobiales bacterium]